MLLLVTLRIPVHSGMTDSVALHSMLMLLPTIVALHGMTDSVALLMVLIPLDTVVIDIVTDVVHVVLVMLILI